MGTRRRPRRMTMAVMDFSRSLRRLKNRRRC
jgi:hypothetical protein